MSWFIVTDHSPTSGVPVFASILCGVTVKTPSVAILKRQPCGGPATGQFYWVEVWPDADSSYYDADVIAWQPLPTPCPGKP